MGEVLIGEEWCYTPHSKASPTKTMKGRIFDCASKEEQKIFATETNRQMENNRAIHTPTHTNHKKNTQTHAAGLTWKRSQKGKSFWSIYHIPSVFFNELVERDRGLRMILMVSLFFPHSNTKHMRSPHAHRTKHTPALWATWSPLASLRCAPKVLSGLKRSRESSLPTVR